MKKNEVKKLIKETALKETPDVFAKIDFKNIEIPPYENKKEIRDTRRRIPRLAWAFASVLVVVGSIFTYNYFDQNKTSDIVMASTEEVLGFPIISSSTLLNEFVVENIANLSTSEYLRHGNNNTNENSEEDELLISSQNESLNRYVNMLEILIGDKTNLKYEMNENSNHTYELSYSTIDLIGNSRTYKAYINEIENNQSKVDYTGNISIDNNEYTFEMEQLKNNNAEQSKLRLYYNLENYVEFSDRTVGKKRYYDMSIYYQGVLQEQSELLLTLNKGQVSASLNVSKNGVDSEYIINKQENKIMNIDYTCTSNSITEKGNINIEAKSEQNGQYYYNYLIKSGNATINSRGKRSNK